MRRLFSIVFYFKWQTCFCLGFSLFLFACAGKSPPKLSVAKTPRSKASATIVPESTEAAMMALAMTDKPYRYGGQSLYQGFDCSGLVCYVYNKLGVGLPRTTAELSKTGQRIALGQLRPGDLVFFSFFMHGSDHVGIYIGDGRFVHAPSSGKRVRIERLDDPYWQKRLTQARRVYTEYEATSR